MSRHGTKYIGQYTEPGTEKEFLEQIAIEPFGSWDIFTDLSTGLYLAESVHRKHRGIRVFAREKEDLLNKIYKEALEKYIQSNVPSLSDMDTSLYGDKSISFLLEKVFLSKEKKLLFLLEAVEAYRYSLRAFMSILSVSLKFEAREWQLIQVLGLVGRTKALVKIKAFELTQDENWIV